MRRILTTCATLLVFTMALLLVHVEVAAAGPCKGSKYKANCVGIAKKAPKAGAKTTRTAGGHGGSQASHSGGGKSGPSKLEIAIKNQEAIARNWGKFVDAEKAYLKCVQSAGAGCRRPGQFNFIDLNGVGVTLTGQQRPAGAPPAPQLTPAQAGAIAVARLSLSANTPNVGPDPRKNKWKMAAVGYPLWLWTDGPSHIGPVGENVGGLSVSLDARVSKTVFRMGDGKSVTCSGTGTPYRVSVRPAAKSPSCGYTYERPSLPSKKYTVTAITYWDVTWSVSGVSGVQTVPLAATAELPVGEVQVLTR